MAAKPVTVAPLIKPPTAGSKVTVPAAGEMVSFGVPPPVPIVHATDAVVAPVADAVKPVAPTEFVANATTFDFCTVAAFAMTWKLYVVLGVNPVTETKFARSNLPAALIVVNLVVGGLVVPYIRS